MMMLKKGIALTLLLLLCACGGGKGGSSAPEVSVAGEKVNEQEASRFLAQASFGANEKSINDVVSTNVETWIERQFNKPQTLHLSYVDALKAESATENERQFFESFWGQAIAGDDQLRQRVAFALSQIYVVSFNGTLASKSRTIASYYDMLGRNAFGNARTLLEDVSLHPAMGRYLSHLKNQKEDTSKGRMPDENYARELMQLFTIGLYELNLDGSVKLGSNNKPIETYSNDDITGLAKVFTGWSYAGADKSNTRFAGGNADPNRDVLPMQSYPQYHSTSAKSFLGVTIGAQSSADPEASLKVALDTLFNHPNFPPFLSKQLIQRLVTSNPSPAYVERVATVFKSNSAGVRGDMKSVIRAILLDSEARNASMAQNASFGKVREPILRLAHWARAFAATSPSGRYAINNTDSETSSIGQSPMRSPSVFNYYRPAYVPPNSSVADHNLVAPEMQISNESSVAAYVNTMQSVIPNGLSMTTGITDDRLKANYDNLIALTDNPALLVDKLNLWLMANAMTSATRTQIINAVSAVTISSTNATSAANARKNRVYLAILLAMACPEYLVQK